MPLDFSDYPKIKNFFESEINNFFSEKYSEDVIKDIVNDVTHLVIDLEVEKIIFGILAPDKNEIYDGYIYEFNYASGDFKVNTEVKNIEPIEKEDDLILFVKLKESKNDEDNTNTDLSSILELKEWEAFYQPDDLNKEQSDPGKYQIRSFEIERSKIKSINKMNSEEQL